MPHIAADAIGSSWLHGNRAAMAGFLVGLLVTFLFVRVNTRLIRARVSWWFHDIESEGGTHVHHMVIGVVLMVVSGVLLIALAPAGLSAQVLALVFGAGVALTLDEFALILNLQDVYWRKEGRLSVDAVVIVVTVASLFVLGLDPFRSLEQPGTGDVGFRELVAGFVVLVIVPVLVCLAKGKVWTGVIGLFVPVVALAGALRLARPSSPWARRRYRKSPKKLARAERREVRLAARWLAWRDAFFDLIGGKPHLPSLPPLGANGVPLGGTDAAHAAEGVEKTGEADEAVTGRADEALEPRPSEAAARAAAEAVGRPADSG